MRIRVALVAWCLLPALGGCGQKGPLYLPDAAPKAVPAAPGTTPAAPTAPETPAADDPATRRKIPTTPDPGSSQ